jgi:hypothetical protein
MLRHEAMKNMLVAANDGRKDRLKTGWKYPEGNLEAC